MTEPELPPGMKAGPEIVRIITVVSETGQLMGISVTCRAPKDVVALIMISPLASGESVSICARASFRAPAPKPDEERKKARMN